MENLVEIYDLGKIGFIGRLDPEISLPPDAQSGVPRHWFIFTQHSVTREVAAKRFNARARFGIGHRLVCGCGGHVTSDSRR